MDSMPFELAIRRSYFGEKTELKTLEGYYIIPKKFSVCCH